MSDPLTVAVERDNLSKLQVLEIRYLGFQGFEGVKYTDCSGQCPTHPLSWSLLQKYHQASLTVLFSAGVKWIDCFRWHTTNRLRFFCAGKGQGGMAYLPRKTESGWVQLFGRWIYNYCVFYFLRNFPFQGGARWLQHSYFGPGSSTWLQVDSWSRNRTNDHQFIFATFQNQEKRSCEFAVTAGVVSKWTLDHCWGSGNYLLSIKKHVLV